MGSFSTFAGRLTLAAVAAGAVVATAWSQTPTATPRQVDITTDSAPGWFPSIELERAARAAADRYLASRDAGRAAEAYAQLDPINAKGIPFADFRRDLDSFIATAGAVKERRVIKLTWTKDPPSAPAPGVYAAFDLVSRFAGVDRNCGYLMLRQAPGGGPFMVMREETNFMDNATATTIEKRQSKAAVDAVWSQISANCPNYPGRGPSPAPLEEASANTVGYPNVAAAMVALHAKAGVTFSTQNGWTLATDAVANTLWSFAPVGNPAYPAVVKRQLVQQNGGVDLQMDVLCEASKEACDELVRTFQQLNRQALKARP